MSGASHANRILDLAFEDGGTRGPLKGFFPSTLPVPSLDQALSPTLDDYFARHRERVDGFLKSALEGLYIAQPVDPLDFIARAALAQVGAAAPTGPSPGAEQPENVSVTTAFPEPSELHDKARSQENPLYPTRQPVPDAKVHWSTPFPGYTPTTWTHESVFANSRDVSCGHKWADPARPSMEELQKRITYSGDGRQKALGAALLFANDVPLNPVGRTGLEGRGLLGKWGPNHAADPIVTRYDPEHGRLQVVVIQRKDTEQVPPRPSRMAIQLARPCCVHSADAVPIHAPPPTLP